MGNNKNPMDSEQPVEVNEKRKAKYYNSPVKKEKKKEPIVSEKLESCRQREISCIEFALANSFLYESRTKKSKFTTLYYGQADGNAVYISLYDHHDTAPHWYFVNYQFDKVTSINSIFSTRIQVDPGNVYHYYLMISTERGVPEDIFSQIESEFWHTTFNKSKYTGKCLEVKINDGRFDGITILDTSEFKSKLILSKTQIQFMEHFKSRILKGSSTRILFNGDPGTGKTELMRNIILDLLDKCTFIIPSFRTSEDLSSILRSCEIFNPCSIILDDIDLFLGSRDHGSHTTLLADFLSFFDGIKKTNVNLLASTNSKQLVDKAAERPGRFNFIIDFTYLNKDQVEQVVKLYFPKKWVKPEVISALTGNDKDNRPMKVTGAFISNLAKNLSELCEDTPNWSLDDTLELIKNSYSGFYLSQINNDNKSIGFK